MVTEDRLRCENIGSVFIQVLNHIYHSWTLSNLFKLSEKGLSSNWWSFLRFGILPKSMHQNVQIRFENCKDFIASEGAHPPQTPPPQTRKICRVTDYIQTIFCTFQSITQETLGLLKFECHFGTFSQTICFKIIKSVFKIVDNFEILLKTCSILG